MPTGIDTVDSDLRGKICLSFTFPDLSLITYNPPPITHNPYPISLAYTPKTIYNIHQSQVIVVTIFVATGRMRCTPYKIQEVNR